MATSELGAGASAPCATVGIYSERRKWFYPLAHVDPLPLHTCMVTQPAALTLLVGGLLIREDDGALRLVVATPKIVASVTPTSTLGQGSGTSHGPIVEPLQSRPHSFAI
jgi:hypothetical protein